MSEIRAVTCPYCGSAAILDGKRIICEDCDAIYTITKQGGAKVKTTGVFEDHENRLTAIELKFQAKPNPDETVELGPEEAPGQPTENEDEEIFEP